MPEMNRDEIAKLEALYASNPEGRVFTHLAEAYRKAGEFDRARKILDQGLTKHPNYASAYVVLGRVQLDVGEAAEAENSFRRVLELDPHNLVALRSLGDIARADGRREQALAYFEELRHQDPGNDEVEAFIRELRAEAAAAPAAEPEIAAAAEQVAEEVQPAPLAEAAPPEPPIAEAPPAEAQSAEPSRSAFEKFEPPPSSVETPGADPSQPAYPEQELEVLGAFADIQPAEPDFGDLVTPDIELDWGTEPAAQEEEQPLPGDLADFAAFGANLEIREDDGSEPAAPPPEEEMPALEFPDVGEPADIDAELAEAELDEEIATHGADVVTETMAQLYRDQGLYERSAEIYRALLKERPHDLELQRNLAEVEALASIIGPDQTASTDEEDYAEAEEPLPELNALPDLEPLPEGEPWSEAEVTASDAWPVTEPAQDEPAIEEPVAELPAIEPPDLEGEPVAAEADEVPQAEAPAADEPPAESELEEDEVESPWTAPVPAAAEAPNPYTWAEAQPEEAEAGPPIGAYFRDLLGWRPSRTSAAPTEEQAAAAFAAPTSFAAEEVTAAEPEPEPEQANFEAPPEMEEQPAVLELTTPTEPPATPADELMPWEEPASPSMPAAPVAPAPPSSASKDPVEAAFEEWFSVVEPADEPPAAPPAEQAEAPPAHTAPSSPAASSSTDSSGDDDDDLEMFRSWLQSLKK